MLSSLLAWEVPDRRKDPFMAEQGYLFLPAPYSMPGIGEGVALYGGFNNYLGHSDLFAIQTTGDAEGTLLGLWDLHLIKRRLFVDLTYLDFSKTGINQYTTRGMNSGRDDYAVAQADHLQNLIAKTTLSFYERRLEIVGSYVRSSSRTTRLLDPAGQSLYTVTDPKKRRFEQGSLSLIVDLTDDRQDPLRGVRGSMELAKSPRQSDFDPNFTTLSWSLSGYAPILNQHTLALHYQRSDAIVSNPGEESSAAIAEQLGYSNCWPNNCPPDVLSQIRNRQLYNQNGNAQSLGGENRLRAYPEDRFKGAHSELIGTELRWNFTSDRKPVDLFFMKDVRTGVQVALFYELGSVSDERSDLWKERRSTQGVGLRFVMGSGFVYRFDYASGDEGQQMVIFVSYPWEAL
jgi:hypothetical protein